MEIKLRDYQETLYQRTRDAFRWGKRVLVVAPCGAGKSYIFSAMTKNTNGDVLVLVHRRELKEQHEKLFRDLGITNARVETYQTERNRLGQYSKPKLLIVDEAHLSRSKGWSEIVEYYDTYTVGLTATPVRLDGAPLGSIYNTMVQGITTKELISRKCLAPYEYYAPVTVETDNLKIQAGDFLLKDLEKLMNDRAIYSDALKSWEKIAGGEKTIAYCVTIDHAKQTAQLFNDAGYASVEIDGNTPTKKRDRIMQDFRDGKITVLCNVGIISEGVSIDDVSCCLLLRPTESHALYWQQAMRCMRYQPGKVAKIIDCVGNYSRNPLPDADVEWDLTKSATKPRRLDQHGNFRIRTCKKCFMVFQTAPVCPFCGTAYELHPKEIKAHEEIRLERITEEKKQELEHLRKRQKLEVRMCTTFDELLKIQKDRGYKNGWAFRMAKMKGIKVERSDCS
ncbi:MAG: DEAD/DEAH box helicase [Oscillospiraceae bacterium]|nr:DEAD/DEAH box helicase [Oscillospiraceae bacterium]